MNYAAVGKRRKKFVLGNVEFGREINSFHFVLLCCRLKQTSRHVVIWY